MTPKKPVGRPSSFRPEYAEQARKLALLGHTDREMADFFEVSEQTLNAWKANFPVFLESMRAGKELADANVAEKLYHRAMGYTHAEEKIFQHDGEIIRAETTKHYPPDTQAASLWLRNRQPKKWRDKQDHVLTGEDGKPIQIEDVAGNEAARRVAFLLMQAAAAKGKGTDGDA